MKEYWIGTKPLWKAFWLLWVAGALITAIAFGLIALAIGPLLSISTIHLSFVVFLFLLLLNPYYLFCWVCVWRCSPNTNNQYWAYAAKGLVLVHIGIFALNILHLANEYPGSI